MGIPNQNHRNTKRVEIQGDGGSKAQVPFMYNIYGVYGYFLELLNFKINLLMFFFPSSLKKILQSNLYIM